MRKSMFVVFFSFKGGVGRSSCLMNTARNMAKQGKDVGVIDFDISAPGVDIFEGTNIREMKNIHVESLGGKSDKVIQKVVVEYFLEVFKDKKMLEESGSHPIVSPPIHEYVYRLKRKVKGEKKDSVTANKWSLDLTEGRTYLMRAADHECHDYEKRIINLNFVNEPFNPEVLCHVIHKILADIKDDYENLIAIMVGIKIPPHDPFLKYFIVTLKSNLLPKEFKKILQIPRPKYNVIPFEIFFSRNTDISLRPPYVY